MTVTRVCGGVWPRGRRAKVWLPDEVDPAAPHIFAGVAIFPLGPQLKSPADFPLSPTTHPLERVSALALGSCELHIAGGERCSTPNWLEGVVWVAAGS